mmetsp:Transcript_28364/g.65191  ORF Transcript_28364/g.65191 Transcript_28364/m.65191 type:complete len:117 (-) Transcript_28364:778-1128(-)
MSKASICPPSSTARAKSWVDSSEKFDVVTTCAGRSYAARAAKPRSSAVGDVERLGISSSERGGDGEYFRLHGLTPQQVVVVLCALRTQRNSAGSQKADDLRRIRIVAGLAGRCTRA